jgi:hypothetical protein
MPSLDTIQPAYRAHALFGHHPNSVPSTRSRATFPSSHQAPSEVTDSEVEEADDVASLPDLAYDSGDSDDEAPTITIPPTRPTSPSAARTAAHSVGRAHSGGRSAWWADTSNHSPQEQAGQIQYGSLLHPVARAAVEMARHRPPKFASHRRSRPAQRDELERTAYPTIPEAIRPSVAEARQAGQPHGLDPPSGAFPAGKIAIEQLFLPGIWERIAEWMVAADAALARLRDTGAYEPPPTLVIYQRELQEWARGAIWDCRVRGDCRLCVPSTASDPPPAADRQTRCMRRDVLTRLAAEVGSDDHDIVAQAGGGGIEARSLTTLDLVFAFPQPGLGEQYAAAAAVIASDMAEGFSSAVFGHPPMVPCRVGPRNVVLQARTRVVPQPDGAPPLVEEYDKARVTFHLSFGARRLDDPTAALPPSPNAGCGDSDMQLHRAAEYGQCAAIVCAAADDEPDVDADAYCLDLTNAYSFLRTQRLDWWMQCYLWHGGIAIVVVVAFGGTHGPQRFSRTMAIPRAVGARRIAQFEAEQPPPPSVGAWVDRRRALQRSGALPSGEEQVRPWAFRSFLDDINGWAHNDTVRVPEHLRRYDEQLGASTTLATGGTPSATDSRASVHLRILIDLFVELGFEVAASKTQCGTAIISIGFRQLMRERRMDCPESKRTGILFLAARMAATLLARAPIVQRDVERLVGRVGNLAQIEPALLLWLHAGYALASPRTRRGVRVRLRLRPGGARELEFTSFLAVASEVIGANRGSPLAPAAALPRTSDAGSCVVISDASGDTAKGVSSGVGGYVFHADRPGHVFIVSAEWPADVRRALADAQRLRAERVADSPRRDMLAVATVEAFAAWAPAQVVIDAFALPCATVFAGVDCMPAATGIDAATSASPQMRVVIRAQRLLCEHWAAAWFSRDHNTDADTLSHPARVEEVVGRAEAAGLTTTVIRELPEAVWAVLRTAAQHAMGCEHGDLDAAPAS